jgi:hypothetical protein
MATLEHVGTFELSSRDLFVIPPLYDINDLDCHIGPCKIGNWRVDVEMEVAPGLGWAMPYTVTARHETHEIGTSAPWWHFKQDAACGRGLIGIFDRAHFHDSRIVPFEQEWTGEPAIPDDLWYSYICEIVERGSRAVFVIPYGAVVNHDGAMDVDTLTVNGSVVAVSLRISGWPDNI